MKARRVWAWPLMPVYAAGLAVRAVVLGAKDGLRRVGMLRMRRLQWPVISIGSLSAGGAGKTPVVIALAELLKAQRWHVNVLSRGYGRAGRGVEQVDLSTADPAARYGDEPVMIAQGAGVPVWVGAERFAAGVAAEGGSTRDVGRCVHILDDGFQHRELARTLDIVLVTEEDLDDALLPAGNRREPLAALRRADVVVLREKERERIEAKVRGLMRADALLWCVRRKLQLAAGRAGARPMAFCAIARPEELWAMLEEADCSLAERFAFEDHHAYSMTDMVGMVARASSCGATGFLTTAKDAVKLNRVMLERLCEVGPFCVAGLEARFVDEAGVVRELEARCR
jgi:tetraacyldisaccharide 4'-kinase